MKKPTIFLVVSSVLLAASAILFGLLWGQVIVSGKNFPSGSRLSYNKIIYLPSFNLNSIATDGGNWSTSKLMLKYDLSKPKRVDQYRLEKNPLIAITGSVEIQASEPSYKDVLYRYEFDENIQNLIDSAIRDKKISIADLENVINDPLGKDIQIRKKIGLPE